MTVKLRAGWTAASRNAVEAARRAEQAGVRAIFIHGRTRDQFYAGTVDYGRTMAFTTLVMYQLFNVFNARSDDRSAFVEMFSNGWVWAAIALSIMLHVGVIYTPFLQEAFSTVDLGLTDWLFCAAVASSALWLRELSKIALRALQEIKSV